MVRTKRVTNRVALIDIDVTRLYLVISVIGNTSVLDLDYPRFCREIKYIGSDNQAEFARFVIERAIVFDLVIIQKYIKIKRVPVIEPDNAFQTKESVVINIGVKLFGVIPDERDNISWFRLTADTAINDRFL